MKCQLSLCHYIIHPQTTCMTLLLRHNGIRFLSQSSCISAPATKKYQDTLLLPKTEFPLRVPPVKRKEHELEIVKKLQLDRLYELQKSWRRDQPEFILHDGPPYANGDPHIGHAVNKILKDITNRYKLLRGYRINYKPGWDCHGLPIELKTRKEQLRSSGHRATPIEIRSAARSVASESVQKQKSMFQRWNIMADWNHPYHTYDKSYIQSQLRLFHDLYEKGFVYRCLKPIFWSPSSQSALAEAELEYKADHESLAVFLALDFDMSLENFAKVIGCQLQPTAKECLERPVQVVIWTPTPWSIPANQAVCFNEREKYSVVYQSSSHPSNRKFYVIASDQVPLVAASLKADFRVVSEFMGKQLTNLTYKHPWFENKKCPLLHGDHVFMDKGTGLVHTAPAHGNDDYVIGLKHNLPIECYIDDEGAFDSRLGKLAGLTATTTAGNTAIIKKLEPNILHKELYTHSYPYDWRTKKPVLVKTSMQWFIDTEKLKTGATIALKEIGIFPRNVQNTMLHQIKARPFWCISRQRVWGIPIPVLYDESTGQPIVNKDIVEKVCHLVEKTGHIDWWWTISPTELLGDVESESKNYTKGKDIFDIWLDSGLSWHLLNDKIADLYLEGYDQFTGWFQSSLLTSLALRGTSPYKNLFVHGFVVDGEKRKMSKSEGNVIDPTSITDGNESEGGLGVDPLRWWVATQGSADGDNITLSTSFLRSADESVQKLRAVLRFLISFVQEEVIESLDIDDMAYEELLYTDQYMLILLNEFQKSVTAEYDEFRYHRALNKALHFATTEISSLYFTWVKDRLYCDLEDSEGRKSAIFVLNQIYLTFIKVLGPAIPFLAEESFSHYSSVNESLFRYTWFNLDEKTWDNPNVKEMFELALDVRTSLNQIIGENNRKEIWVELICNQKNYKMLQVLHSDKCNSELCDLLQVSGVQLHCNDQAEFHIQPFGVSHSLNGFSLGVTKTELERCHRCRRYCCTEGISICSRCQSVLKRLHFDTSSAAGGEEVSREILRKDVVNGRP